MRTSEPTGEESAQQRAGGDEDHVFDPRGEREGGDGIPVRPPPGCMGWGLRLGLRLCAAYVAGCYRMVFHALSFLGHDEEDP